MPPACDDLTVVRSASPGDLSVAPFYKNAEGRERKVWHRYIDAENRWSWGMNGKMGSKRLIDIKKELIPLDRGLKNPLTEMRAACDVLQIGRGSRDGWCAYS